MASLAASNNLVSGAKLTNPVAVFVGGTSGIGQGMAEAFNRHMKGNCHIVIVGRNYDAAESIISTMKSVAGESSTGSYEFVHCDISRMSNVKQSAATIIAKYPQINFLVISAGVFGSASVTTEEGLDKGTAINYHGRWTFIHELLPALRSARDANHDAKVMSVLAAGRIRLSSTENDLMCEEYALRNPGIVFSHSFPGAVRTNIFKTSDSMIVRVMIGTVFPLLLPFTVSQDECGEYLWSGLYSITASAGSGEIPGSYRIGSKGEDLGMKSYFGTPEKRKALWEQTCKDTNTADE